MKENAPENPKASQEHFAIKVELAKPEDWELCKQLRLDAIQSEDARYFGITPENRQTRINKKEAEGEVDWQEKLFTPEGFGVLVWKGEKPVGIGLVKKRETEGDWYIYGGYIKKEFRGGAGKKLFAKRLEEIVRRGGKVVRMGVHSINHRSIHLAESFGFKEVSEGSSEEHFYMQLDNASDPEVLKKINLVLDER